MTPDERLAKIKDAWLKLCGSCDAGLTTACTCPDRDPRQDIGWLAERLRDAQAENERWKRATDDEIALLNEVQAALGPFKSREFSVLDRARRLVAELADAQAENERLGKQLTGVHLMLSAQRDRADAAEARLAAAREWAMVNEIAAPPLDWAALGAALDAGTVTE